jgi:hypothetical protein
MLPGNVKKNANIQALRDAYTCMKADATCPGTHCYVDPETNSHLPLSHEKLDCWASAMVCSNFHLQFVLLMSRRCSSREMNTPRCINLQTTSFLIPLIRLSHLSFRNALQLRIPKLAHRTRRPSSTFHLEMIFSTYSGPLRRQIPFPCLFLHHLFTMHLPLYFFTHHVCLVPIYPSVNFVSSTVLVRTF